MDEPLDVLKLISRVFGDLKIDYMIVGSTALRAYIPGRSTFDTDILVRMDQKQLDDLCDTLGDDWYLDRRTARSSLETRRMFNAIHFATSWKLDLIPLKDEPYQAEEFRRRRKEAILGIPFYVQAPEDLVLSKLLWAAKGGSKRQIEDVRHLLKAQLDLDIDYLEKWATALRLEALLEEARGG